MPDVLVDARSVTRRYGVGAAAVDAVVNASCRIVVGDRIALTGPSGSGKSTLLYLLAGLETPSAGEIVWPSLANGGRPPASFAGFVFQTPNLLPLTAIENVAAPLLIAGEPADRAQRASRSMLEALDLGDVADRFAEDLSGGQAERVGLARALVVEPTLLLVDEPTGQLDTATAARMIDRMLESAERFGAAVIVATHDERVASRLKTRWTMRHGRLETSS